MADVFIVNAGGSVHSVTEEHCDAYCKVQTEGGLQFKAGFRLATKEEIASYKGEPGKAEAKQSEK